MTMIAGDYTVALLDESDARISSVKNVFVDESFLSESAIPATTVMGYIESAA